MAASASAPSPLDLPLHLSSLSGLQRLYPDVDSDAEVSQDVRRAIFDIDAALLAARTSDLRLWDVFVVGGEGESEELGVKEEGRTDEMSVEVLNGKVEEEEDWSMDMPMPTNMNMNTKIELDEPSAVEGLTPSTPTPTDDSAPQPYPPGLEPDLTLMPCLASVPLPLPDSSPSLGEEPRREVVEGSVDVESKGEVRHEEEEDDEDMAFEIVETPRVVVRYLPQEVSEI